MSHLQILPVEIAAVISQTYVELGDGAPLSDDEALQLIREMLLGYDERLIDSQRKRGVALAHAWRQKEKSNVH